MIDNLANGCHTTERDRRNGRRVTIGTLVWGAAFLGATYALTEEILTGAAAVVAAVVTALLGLGVVVLYRRFLVEADELRRKIELEGLAAAVGVGVVGGLAYWLLERAGVLEADVAYVVTAMLLTHGLATILGHRRYS